jgi:VCBS repeat-containing protein
VSDPDDIQAFVAQSNVVGTYGTFSIAADGTWSYTANSAYDNLNVGQTISETFTVASTDGTTGTVQVTIQGTNDAAVISSASVVVAETNAAITASGTLSVSDVDDPSSVVPQSNVAGAYGTFSIAANGQWTYTASSAYDSLNVGQSVSDTFTVSAADGTTSTVQVTIAGTNDAAVVSTANTTLAETNSAISASGALSITDADDAPVFVAQSNVAGTYGTFSIAADGSWSYVAYSAYDNLNVGQSVSDTFTVTAADGTTSTVQVTISGTDDAAVISAANFTLTAGDTPASTGGILAISDPDNAPAFVPQTIAGAMGSFSLAADGTWTYTTNSAALALAPNQSRTDTFTVQATDGTTAVVRVTVVKQLEFVVSHETLPAGSASVAVAAPAAPLLPAAADRSAAAGAGAGLPLGLPVDVSVPASDMAGARMPQGAREAGLLGAYLQETTDLAGGFPLVRMPAARAEIVSPLEMGDGASGQRLFVYHGIPDMQIGSGTPLSVPRDAFAHTDPRAIVILEARLADGSPLPSWISFEGESGVFIATPPRDTGASIDLEVTARDNEGRAAHTVFALQLQPVRAGEDRAAEGVAPDASLGLDVDKQEAEKARLKVAKERTGAASFSEQVGAAKRRDPLLERIVRTRPIR